MRGLGQGVREFKKGVNEINGSDKQETKADGEESKKAETSNKEIDGNG